MGQSDKTQKAQLDTQNQLAQQQLNATNSDLSQVNSSVAPYLTGNVGFTPQQLAAMNSSVLDQNAAKFNAAGQQVNAQAAARGENGMTPISGVGQNGYGNLAAAKASDLSTGLNTVVQNNAQQALANQMNAASILSGNAQTLAGTTGTFNSGASSALNNVTQAQSNSFLSNLGKGLGAGIGAGGSAAFTGGFGSAASALSGLGKSGTTWANGA